MGICSKRTNNTLTGVEKTQETLWWMGKCTYIFYLCFICRFIAVNRKLCCSWCFIFSSEILISNPFLLSSGVPVPTTFCSPCNPRTWPFSMIGLIWLSGITIHHLETNEIILSLNYQNLRRNGTVEILNYLYFVFTRSPTNACIHTFADSCNYLIHILLLLLKYWFVLIYDTGISLTLCSRLHSNQIEWFILKVLWIHSWRRTTDQYCRSFHWGLKRKWQHFYSFRSRERGNKMLYKLQNTNRRCFLYPIEPLYVPYDDSTVN